MSLVTFVTAPFTPDRSKKEREYDRRRQALNDEIKKLTTLVKLCRTDPLCVYKATCCGMERVDELSECTRETVAAWQQQYENELERAHETLAQLS